MEGEMRKDRRKKGEEAKRQEQGRVESARLGTGGRKWQHDPQNAPPHPAHAQPRAPFCVSSLLCALQRRWGVQAGWALRGRVPHLQEGINTCGDNVEGGSKAVWKAPVVVRPTPPYTLGASIP